MDKDFYKFRQSIEQQREIPFEENDWDKMNQRLDAAEKGTRKPIPLWWMLAAAASIAVILGYVALYSSLQESRQINEQLLGRLENSGQQAATHSVDTIFQKEYVVVRDTINTTKIIYKKGAVKSADFQRYAATTNQTFLKKDDWSTLPQLLNTQPNSSLGALLSEVRSERMEITRQKKREEWSLNNQSLVGLAIPKLDFLAYNSLLLDDYQTETEPVIDTKKRHQLKALFHPVGFLAGVSGGLNNLVDKSSRNGLGNNFGINAEVQFLGNVRLWTNLSYNKLRYEKEEIDPKLGIPFVESPGDDFIFENADVALNTMTILVGMKKLWNANGKIQPFVSVGMGAMQILPYHALYDYENDVLGIDVKTEVDVEQYTFVGGVGQFGLGAEYKLNDHWRLGTEGFFRTQLDKGDFKTPDYVSLKVSLLRQF